MLCMGTLSGPEILINRLFLSSVIAAIIHGVSGWLHYTKRELWCFHLASTAG